MLTITPHGTTHLDNNFGLQKPTLQLCGFSSTAHLAHAAAPHPSLRPKLRQEPNPHRTNIRP